MLPKRVYKFSSFGTSENKDVYPVVLSDGSVDRHGDTVNQDGWNLAAYKDNPVLLWAHDDTIPPIGRVENVRVADGKLVGEMKFASTPFATEIKGLVDEGMLKTVSVGFAPEEGQPAKSGGWEFSKQELWELSVVPIPANPQAKLLSVKGGGNPAMVFKWASDALRFCAPPPAQTEPTPAPAAPPAPAPEPELSEEQIAEVVRSAIAERRAALRTKRTGKLD